jgi:nicotinamidase-related amidase
MDDCGGHFVIAGFAGETACLSTMVDAYHRGHQVTYLSDASASHDLGDLPGQTVQQAVTEIIRVYGDVLDTESWVAGTSRARTALSKAQ